jgi:hypothetical protein
MFSFLFLLIYESQQKVGQRVERPDSGHLPVVFVGALDSGAQFEDENSECKFADIHQNLWVETSAFRPTFRVWFVVTERKV